MFIYAPPQTQFKWKKTHFFCFCCHVTLRLEKVRWMKLLTKLIFFKEEKVSISNLTRMPLILVSLMLFLCLIMNFHHNIKREQ